MLDNNSALVENALEVLNLLKKIQKSKQLIELSFNSLPQYSLTSLLEVNHDTKTLFFDEPNPLLSSKLIKNKSKAKFSLKMDKLPIIFETRVCTTNDFKDSNELQATFPKEIYYPQNRNYYRFNTENISEVRATIYLSSSNILPCELVNISLAGICITLPYSFAKFFQLNQIIDDIYIELPDSSSFSISAKVQNLRKINNYANIAIGLHIQQQKPKTEKIIQQFIFRTENS